MAYIRSDTLEIIHDHVQLVAGSRPLVSNES